MTTSEERVTLLVKSGRLASWHRLTDQERTTNEQEHVDLMLDIAQQHQMLHMEGFRLIGPQGAWERFWVLEFPTQAGAESWIKAEMAPPYGRYGYYEYHLARPNTASHWADWAAGVRPVPSFAADPHEVPPLTADFDSVVALLFERGEPGLAPGEKPVTPVYLADVEAVCRQGGLQRLECFTLVAPQAQWHQVWLAQFADLAAIEAWISVETGPTHGCFTERTFVLTRPWAPAYFASWVPKA